MRAIGVVIHRWAGLFTAMFLLISGLTGAVISSRGTKRSTNG